MARDRRGYCGGSVFQNPRSQFFNVDTTSELAFSCENMGMPEPEVRSRMEKAVGELNLRPLLDRSIFELSGGEKQRIVCGSVSTLSPAVMVLDEPTSNLDFPGIESLRKIIEMWKSQGRTVIVAEHRLHFLRGVADRVIYMDSGEIMEQFSGADFFAKPAGFFEQRGLRMPELTRVFDREFPEHKPTGTFVLRNFSCSYKSGVTALDIPEAHKVLLPGNAGRESSAVH
ncbi:MAG: ABC transporter ATP-binding protein [Ruminococcaceae bacterium]|nr:ABC transporter ATP-binding protein [Oscillospiraceae bacterium]